MKKFFKLFLFTLILFNLTPAMANTLNVSTASYSIVVNGEKWQPANPIISINGKTYLPLTEIAELLNVDVSWNEKKRQVEISNENVSSKDVEEEPEDEIIDEDTEEEADSENETYSSYFEWLMDWYGFNEDEDEAEENDKNDVVAEESEDDDYIFSLDWLWSWDDDSQIKVSYGSESKSEASEETTTSSSTSKNYVASKSGSKYHLSTCSSAKKIKSANKTYFASASKAESAGYSPCSICIE